MIESGGITTGQLILVIVTLVAGIVGLFWLLMASRDREHAAVVKQLEVTMKQLEDTTTSLKSLVFESVKYAHDLTNHDLRQQGKPPVAFVAPVISESGSPSTQLQRDMSFIATQRAALAVLQITQGNPPRVEPAEKQ